MRRTLSPEERAVWRRVTADVRRARKIDEVEETMAATPAVAPAKPVVVAPVAAKPPTPKVRRMGSGTLDARWDRQLTSGEIVADRVVDLHGCTLDTAHRLAVAEIGAAHRAGNASSCL